MKHNHFSFMMRRRFELLSLFVPDKSRVIRGALMRTQTVYSNSTVHSHPSVFFNWHADCDKYRNFSNLFKLAHIKNKLVWIILFRSTTNIKYLCLLLKMFSLHIFHQWYLLFTNSLREIMCIPLLSETLWYTALTACRFLTHCFVNCKTMIFT